MKNILDSARFQEGQAVWPSSTHAFSLSMLQEKVGKKFVAHSDVESLPVSENNEAANSSKSARSPAFYPPDSDKFVDEAIDHREAIRLNQALEQLAAATSLLMLQGPIGPMFERIAQWKRGFGHQVTRVVFNGGDSAYCDDKDAIYYRDNLQEWPKHLAHYLSKHKINGVLLFGQTRPYHCNTIRICQQKGIPVFVMEEGYIRPGFMTLELYGVNAYSTTLGRYKLNEQAVQTELLPDRVSWHKLRVTYHALRYYAHLWLKGWRYRHYQHHRRSSPVLHAIYWSLAALNYPITRWYDISARKQLYDKRPLFFVPLQLDSDAQIVHHSPFYGMHDFIDEVLYSFSMHSPSDAFLLIKQHPLARGHMCMHRQILNLAASHGVADRVIFIHACKIYQILDTVAGVVTVNSTVGIQAIAHGAPLKIMGEAVYDHPDVVDRQPLDSFWKNPFRPDLTKARSFHQQLKVLTQVPAALYDPSSQPLNWNSVIFGKSRSSQ